MRASIFRARRQVATAARRRTRRLELVRGGVTPDLETTGVVRYLHGTRITSDADHQRVACIAGMESRLVVLDSVGNIHDEARRAATSLGGGWRAPARGGDVPDAHTPRVRTL